MKLTLPEAVIGGFFLWWLLRQLEQPVIVQAPYAGAAPGTPQAPAQLNFLRFPPDHAN